LAPSVYKRVYKGRTDYVGANGPTYGSKKVAPVAGVLVRIRVKFSECPTGKREVAGA